MLASINNTSRLPHDLKSVLFNMPPFKDEHILLIAPGSQTTLAQLGLPESFTPARLHFPTRMFPAEKKGEFEPYKVRERRREAHSTNGAGIDVDMRDASAPADKGETKVALQSTPKLKAADGVAVTNKEQNSKSPLPEEVVYEEDIVSMEGAIYPMQNGRIADWQCFFSLLTHIYNTLSPPFHTPIMLISEPVWSARDREVLTQFIFEKFKTPAFCLMDSALAACYAYGTPTATVVDIGHGKADVTAVTDFVVQDHGRGIAVEGCGGKAMTDRLVELLRPKGFTREMCEQIKRSNITEILPFGTPLPATISPPKSSNTALLSSTGSLNGRPPMPRGPGGNAQPGNGEGDEDDGVLNVAAIVSGNTSEFLAKREKERAERTVSKKSDPMNKPSRLPNAKKDRASFQFEEYTRIEPQNGAFTTAGQYIRQKREIEVGVERFLLTAPSKEKTADRCSGGILEDLASQIHHTILSVPDSTKRSELWDSLIILGNGSKVKGFTTALISTITQRFMLSPSATIFTSELPSNISTPLATGGTNTPSHPGQTPGPFHHPAAHGVNPLLVAATHANNPIPATSANHDPAISTHHRSTGHSQTPTSIKTLKPPEYFPEWKDQGGSNAPVATGAGVTNTTGPASSGGRNPPTALVSNRGMEEAVFLGAQIAAKVIFVLDQGLSKGFLSRVEYNEGGPATIHESSFS
ncbi:hypothetical protein Egran_00744 [Elaphomyces granulatus]|uniref:Actin-like ATPase domain-containing protein n=1 Tax=Elaphomyces granulatus TaxID=519963 RepID=A0A232M586_9EURO|nr:hypothetical protein Egran_00744 [Elaphomyces granulatus]